MHHRLELQPAHTISAVEDAAADRYRTDARLSVVESRSGSLTDNQTLTPCGPARGRTLLGRAAERREVWRDRPLAIRLNPRKCAAVARRPIYSIMTKLLTRGSAPFPMECERGAEKRRRCRGVNCSAAPVKKRDENDVSKVKRYLLVE